jgi:hypothetical protein
MRLWELVSTRRVVAKRCLRGEGAMERWAGVSELQCCRWQEAVFHNCR